MFCPFLNVVVCREHAQYPTFAPGSSKVEVGFRFFGFFFVCVFVSFVQNLP